MTEFLIIDKLDEISSKIKDQEYRDLVELVGKLRSDVRCAISDKILWMSRVPYVIRSLKCLIDEYKVDKYKVGYRVMYEISVAIEIEIGQADSLSTMICKLLDQSMTIFLCNFDGVKATVYDMFVEKFCDLVSLKATWDDRSP